MSYNGSVQEPDYKPYCCSQQSKWICHSVNLHYFYCEICKKEVDPNAVSPKVSNLCDNWGYGSSDIHIVSAGRQMGKTAWLDQYSNGVPPGGYFPTPKYPVSKPADPVSPFPLGKPPGVFSVGDRIWYQHRVDGVRLDGEITHVRTWDNTYAVSFDGSSWGYSGITSSQLEHRD